MSITPPAKQTAAAVAIPPKAKPSQDSQGNADVIAAFKKRHPFNPAVTLTTPKP